MHRRRDMREVFRCFCVLCLSLLAVRAQAPGDLGAQMMKDPRSPPRWRPPGNWSPPPSTTRSV